MTTCRPILIIASRADIAGGENYLLSVLRHLDAARFRAIVVVPGEGPFREALTARGVESVVMEVDYGWLRPPQTWYPFLSGFRVRVEQLRDLIRARDVALVHTNSNQILEGALAARIAGVPHVHLAHIDFQSNLPVYERAPIDGATFARLMEDLSTRIIAVSHFVARTLSPPVLPENIQVIHNGLEIEVFEQGTDAARLAAAAEIRAELGLAPDVILVVSAGRLHPDKGFDYFIEAAGRVLPGRNSVHFLLAGGEEARAYVDELKARVAELGIAGRFHFLGFRRDIQRIFAAADIFVLSSRREGHPYVLLEAMACGCAPVASRCGGADETIVDGQTGFLTDIGDVDTLGAKLAALLDAPEQRSAIARAARDHVRENFNAPRQIGRLAAAYEEILALPPPRAGSAAVDLFLRAANEIGTLGEQVTDLRERMKRAERAADLLLDNPLMRLLRRMRGGSGR